MHPTLFEIPHASMVAWLAAALLLLTALRHAWHGLVRRAPWDPVAVTIGIAAAAGAAWAAATRLGPGDAIPVPSYGVLVTFGFLAAIGLTAYRAKARHIDLALVLDLAILFIVFGILGARLFYYVQFYSSPHTNFATRPWYVFFYVWEGGIVYFGGLVAGATTGVIYLLIRRQPILSTCDLIAPAIPLGHAIGRIGCLLFGCCWGSICSPSFPFQLRFPGGSPAHQFHSNPTWLASVSKDLEHVYPIGTNALQKKLAEEGLSLPVHPTQVYALTAGLLLCALTLLYDRKFRTRDGQTFFFFLLFYSLARFVLEFYRGDTPFQPSLTAYFTAAQEVSIATGIVAVAAFSITRFFSKS